MRIPIAAIAWVPGRKTIAVALLIAASFVGAFEYQPHYAGWTGRPAARMTNDGAEDFAGFDRWKRGVEETLKAAALREQRDREKSITVAAATKPNGVLQEKAASPVDSGIDRKVARLETKNENNDANETGKAAVTNEAGAAKEDEPPKQTKALDPFSRSPVIDPVSSGRPEALPGRSSRHAWGRARSHGRHYGWSYHRLVGVARAFPFILSVR